MLTVSLLLLGAVLLALVLVDRPVRRLPLTPAVIYLAIGWMAGAALGAPSGVQLDALMPSLLVGTELAVLVSLFAVGVRLRVPPSVRSWRVALLMAGPGMVVCIVLGALFAAWLLGLPWGAALLLSAVLAPTDPVLASEVQIQSDADRDAVRLSLTAEGGLNDGTALPAVLLALGLLNLHDLGDGGLRWWLRDLAWPILGGVLLGMGIGWSIGHALRLRLEHGDKVARDELLYVGAVLLAYGLARATDTSTFMVVFACGATLLWPLRSEAVAEGTQALAQRLQSFGARIERLVEAGTVLAVGVALHSVPPSLATMVFALASALVVRPFSVLVTVWRGSMTTHQRRLVAWFGIRGIGTLFYLAFALRSGVSGTLAAELLRAGLATIAVSIVLHGVSATPLMVAYQRRRRPVPEARRGSGDPPL